MVSKTVFEKPQPCRKFTRQALQSGTEVHPQLSDASWHFKIVTISGHFSWLPGLWTSHGTRNCARKCDKLADSELRHVLVAPVVVTRSRISSIHITYICMYLYMCAPMSPGKTMNVDLALGIRTKRNMIAPISTTWLLAIDPVQLRTPRWVTKRSINKILSVDPLDFSRLHISALSRFCRKRVHDVAIHLHCQYQNGTFWE